jgi:hypothetical protein
MSLFIRLYYVDSSYLGWLSLTWNLTVLYTTVRSLIRNPMGVHAIGTVCLFLEDYYVDYTLLL